MNDNCKRKTIRAPKTGGAAHLIICDDATLTARINIDEGQSLCIYGQEQNTGQLIAQPIVITGEDEGGVFQNCAYFPPIGSRRNMGKLTVHGSKITAKSDVSLLTGIGGGLSGNGGGQDASGAEVLIEGGTFIAKGGADAAGIGSGEHYTSGKDLIDGGFPFETRVPACFFRPYTCIEVR